MGGDEEGEEEDVFTELIFLNIFRSKESDGW